MKSLFFSAALFAASLSTSFAQSQQPVAADSVVAVMVGKKETIQSQQPVAADSWRDETAPAANEAPRYNTGWNTAPGQSLSLHERPSTDYRGRPLKKRYSSRTSTAARAAAYQEQETTDPMMRSSGVMVAPGMNTAPYRRVSTDYWGRPLKRKSKGASTLARKVEKATPVAANTAGSW